MDLEDKHADVHDEIDKLKTEVKEIKYALDEIKEDAAKFRNAQLSNNRGCGCLPLIAIGLALYIAFHTIWKLPEWVSKDFVKNVQNSFQKKEILK